MVDDGPAAGWYEDPEHPGWVRYWDGSVWTDHRSAAPAAAPLAPQYERSQAGFALGLSIVGILGCAPLGLIGLIQGMRELRRISDGRIHPDQRGMALGATIIGGLVTLLMVVFFGFLVAFVLLAGDPP